MTSVTSALFVVMSASVALSMALSVLTTLLKFADKPLILLSKAALTAVSWLDRFMPSAYASRMTFMSDKLIS